MAEKKKEDSLKWAFFRDFVPALKQQPAYLLIFGIAALFFLIAISTALGAVIQSNAQLWWISFLGLLASLAAAVIVIWRVQAPAAPPRAMPATTDEDQKLQENSAIRVLRNNGEMRDQVRDFLNRRADIVRKVIVVQYSGWNVADTLREILDRPGIDVEIYLVKPSRCVNEHQEARVIEFARKFRNQFREARNRNWQLFTYDAPGSIRAVLIKGQVLFTGAYQYEVVDTLDPHVLDIRGGEKPLLMVPSGNPGFEMLANELEDLVQSWKQTKDHSGNVTATPYEPSFAQKA